MFGFQALANGVAKKKKNSNKFSIISSIIIGWEIPLSSEKKKDV
jgi:hypothetical protein